MTQLLSITDFWQAPGPILDVRSPGEYAQGHLPHAVSFPLFSDEERAQVGTCYKQQGKETAVELGLEIVGPKMAGLVKQAKTLAPERQVRVHCWRGGMRSGSVGWLLETSGLDVALLTGGYKAFRGWVRSTLAMPRPMIVVGGMTGTGKTDILHALRDLGEQVLDLEGLANHRGSSYGALMQPPQPSTEQFENLLAEQWCQFSPDRPVWIEAESRQVGACRVPDEIMQQMEAANTLEILRSEPERLKLLVEIYGQADPDGLIAATERLQRRLGGLRTQTAVEHIKQGDLAAAASVVLSYYDRTYRHDLVRRGKEIPTVNVAEMSAMDAARCLLYQVKNWEWYSSC
ncbi:tRNA 2-selenouridine(34) synthase MnmH [Leptothoe kymatousa]|uniref:tRNA 2-selenouridine(34) synthase MnmH n=1 Tax=Leptothoe kymatousa TAU-MAC 1615 TaxID=2364775 RepID=A0ABS5Y147_9CYAN|nr:tRNA 2-selenouridine(34) synthase MnmH [Leptothoe kymatousa]MBT9311539.1 tRNA 2-selenouridine(34) synthase MnmH [Leptothoe kymatousa TAU-MAC 1615]